MKTLSLRSLQLLLAAYGIWLVSGPLVAMNAKQASYDQVCQLDDSCPIPGNDDKATAFVVYPQDGMKFSCKVDAEHGKLQFWVGSEDNFKIKQGWGWHDAAPSAIINISGRFSEPNDNNKAGRITIKRLFGSEGMVTCRVAN